MAEKGKSVLLSSHILADLEDVANRILVIKDKKILEFESMEAFRFAAGSNTSDGAFERFWSKS